MVALMVMDAVRDRALLYGGAEFAETPDPTLHQLDLSVDPPAWSAIPATNLPTARLLHTGIIDPAHDKLVVFGGYTAAGGEQFFGDTWALPLGDANPRGFPAPTGFHSGAEELHQLDLRPDHRPDDPLVRLGCVLRRLVPRHVGARSRFAGGGTGLVGRVLRIAGTCHVSLVRAGRLAVR